MHDSNDLLQLLTRVADGTLASDDAARAITSLNAGSSRPTLGFVAGEGGVLVDTDRCARTGQPEVVYAPGKSLTQVVAAATAIAGAGQPVLVTRASEEQLAVLTEALPDGQAVASCGLFASGHSVDLLAPCADACEAAVISAGAADAPVADEAYATARFYGVACARVSDAGVAGLHRLGAHDDVLSATRLHIVVAGMEGALPSVVAGRYGKPVIGVPTSVGYGTGLGGLAALASMLNGCAPGISVVNIDNGYGAGALAAKLLAMQDAGKESTS